MSTSPWQTITLRDGATLRARIAGSGTPLLLLGNLVSWEFWHHQIPFFAQHYRVIAPAYRGRPRPGCSALDALAADVPDLLARLGESRALLMGHSIGAMVLARLLEQQPQVARAVVLANGFLWLRLVPPALHRVARRVQPHLTPLLWTIYPRLPWVARQLLAFGLLWGTQLIFLRHEPACAKREMFFAYTNTGDGSMIMRLSAALEYAHPPDLSGARVPVLLVSGAHDTWMQPWERNRLAQRLPCGTQVVVAGRGHMTPMVAPDVFNTTVLAFFRRVESGML
ncbi:alpha/beta fold hydrolase [Kallotenue papyrolyticum]|uniref:alpha/beta fold hydrolase n=1 Tax=Kallotenue papyrolyticum TaxID=1325125 RepID=UPI00047106DF|nr:alpha/beta hydrolase [Kallotenue papyrolyticum]